MNLEKLMAKLDGHQNVQLPVSEKELCDRYEQLYTGAVNDVLREHTLLDQTLPKEILPLKMDMKAAGIAYTIRSVKNPSLKGEMEKRAEMLDDMPEACMVVWDTGGEAEAIKNAEKEIRSWVHKGFSAKKVVKKGGYF